MRKQSVKGRIEKRVGGNTRMKHEEMGGGKRHKTESAGRVKIAMRSKEGSEAEKER